MAAELYPLKVSAVFQQKIWGGPELKAYVDLPDSTSWGEVWLISDNEPGSVITNGGLKGKSLRAVCSAYQRRLLGTESSLSDRFPLILKLLNARAHLSIQVHPDARYAQQCNEAPTGKTESWFILKADPGSYIHVGFKAPVERGQVRNSIRDGDLVDYLNNYEVTEGEALYLPPGRVHSIGPGIIILEIQQNCPVTYRLFDFDRIDPATGCKRPLDINKALDVLEYARTERPTTRPITEQYSGNRITTFVACDFFCGQKISLSEPLPQHVDESSCAVYTSFDTVETRLTMLNSHQPHSLTIARGETVLVPAQTGSFVLESDGLPVTLFKYFIPNMKKLHADFQKRGYTRPEIEALGT